MSTSASGGKGTNVGNAFVKLMPDMTGFSKQVNASLNGSKLGSTLGSSVSGSLAGSIKSSVAQFKSVIPSSFSKSMGDAASKGAGAFTSKLGAIKGTLNSVTGAVNSAFVKSVGKISDMAGSAAGAVKAGCSAAISAVKGVGSVAVDVGKKAAAGAAAAVGAFSLLAKTSVGAYADYEQMVGGAGKIFGDSIQSQIISDARSAWSTLNLSANDYMESINNVGSTLKANRGAADAYTFARRGMQAISDYATGTGKDLNTLNEKFAMISRSTSVYQSIADQFSGILPQTSADFLAQAKAAGYLSGSYKSLQEVNVADYQRALIQMLERGTQQLGLAGNTAEETADTLSGSILGVKALWQNVLTDMASGSGADLSSSVSSFVSQFSNTVAQVTPRVANVAAAVPQIVGAIVPHIPEIAAPVMQSFLDTSKSLLLQMLPNLDIEGLTGGIKSIISGFTDALGISDWSGDDFIASVVNVINTYLIPTLYAAHDVIYAVVSDTKSVLDGLDIKGLLSGILGLFTGLFEGVAAYNTGDFVAGLPDTINALLPLLQVAHDFLFNIGQTIAAIADNIDWQGLADSVTLVITSFVSGFTGSGVDPVSTGNAIADMINALIPLLQAFAPLAAFIGSTIKFIGDNLSWLVPLVLGLVGALNVANAIVNVISFAQIPAVSSALASLCAFLVSPAGIAVAIAAVTALLVAFFTQTETGRQILSGIVSWFTDVAGPAVVGFFTQTIPGALGALWDTVYNFFSGLWEFISSIPQRMFDAGVSIVQGLIDGVGSMLGGLIDTAANIGGTIVDGVKNFLGIHRRHEWAQIRRFRRCF